MISRKRSKSKATAGSGRPDRPAKSKVSENRLAKAVFAPDTAEDLELAEKIGKTVEVSEIEFAAWQKVHSDLDLQIPVWIKSEELLQENLTKTIQFSRSVKSNPDEAPVRERDSFTFQIPGEVSDGTRIIAEKKGDKKGEFFGDLIIILRVKR